MDNHSKIGVFDSGLGGLSVLHTIQQLMPNESIIYIGDSINAPYGTKDKDEVFELSKHICDRLIALDVKAIVIACNTATSAAVSRLRELYELPIIGMEPAVKPALAQTKGRVLVLATEMTLKEEKFAKLIEGLEDGYRVIKMPAPELVDVVENHFDDEAYVELKVKQQLDHLENSIDAVVLGCTHFIFLKRAMEQYFSYNVELFDGNMGTAMQLKSLLESKHLLSDHEGSGNIEIINTKSEVNVTKSFELLRQLEKRESY